jgi:hypothetical protein
MSEHPKFEYMPIRFDTDYLSVPDMEASPNAWAERPEAADLRDLKRFLDGMGAEGWHCVGMSDGVIILTRMIRPEPPPSEPAEPQYIGRKYRQAPITEYDDGGDAVTELHPSNQALIVKEEELLPNGIHTFWRCGIPNHRHATRDMAQTCLDARHDPTTDSGVMPPEALPSEAYQ